MLSTALTTSRVQMVMDRGVLELHRKGLIRLGSTTTTWFYDYQENLGTASPPVYCTIECSGYALTTPEACSLLKVEARV